MADRKPLKVLPDSASGSGGGDSTGLGEFVAADTVGVVDGGTGLATVGSNQLLTGNGTSALTSESNLTFDGNDLVVNGTDSALLIGCTATDTDQSTYNVVQIGDQSSLVCKDGTSAGTDAYLGHNVYLSSGSWKHTITDEAEYIGMYSGKIVFNTAASASADAAFNGATRMEINSAGAVTKPTHPAFLCRYAGSHLNATGNGTFVVINGNTEVFDRGANYTDGNFTAPVSGTYFFTSNLYLEGLTSATTTLYHVLETSDDGYSSTEVSAMGMTIDPWSVRAGNGAFSVTNSWVIDMAANDTARCKVQVSGGSSDFVDIMGSSSTMNTFGGFLIG